MKPAERSHQRNAYFEKIFEALGGHVDPETFERCVCALLGASHVPGGSDSGVDGLIPDPEGEYPLVITSGQRPVDNLKRSLDSYLKAGLPAQRVAVATRLSLTAAQRRRLTAVARDRGFTITRSLARHDLADLLYRNSGWAKELLGIASTPPALSKVPSSRRPWLDIDPIGRGGDIEWLQSTPGDRLLYGQPGSGKTFLLARMVRDGWNALYVESDDAAEIADALRDLAPRALIVDDAHAHTERLETLLRLRRQGHEFDIVATAWEGARAGLLTLLHLPESKSRRLELLTRKEILQIYTAMGIPERIEETVRDAWLRELIDQAGNKPGLAVTIGTLWLYGGGQEIVRGEVLGREILQFLEQTVGDDSASVLGCFSLGGKRGMRLEAVGALLGINRSQIWRIVTDLSAGGVLKDLGEGALAVEPEPLRSALLRATFFPDQGPPLMDYGRALGSVASWEHAVEALLRARGRGVKVPDQDLRQLVDASTGRYLWERLASLSQENAMWVIEKYSGDVVDIARGALTQAPLPIVRKLLASAESDREMSLLSSWIKGITGSTEAIDRRRVLARAGLDHLRAGGSLESGARAIFLALSPNLEDRSVDPGAGNTVTYRDGLLPVSALQEIESIWFEAHGAITNISTGLWPHVKGALWSWIFPEWAARTIEISAEHERFMKGFAASILADLAPLAVGSPGLAAGLRRLADSGNIEISVPIDPLFELLFPADDLSADEDEKGEEGTERSNELNDLATMMATRPATKIAQMIAWYSGEAKRIAYAGPGNTIGLSRLLSSLISEPEVWLEAFLAEEMPSPWASSVLERLVRERKAGWEVTLLRCLDIGPISRVAVALVLTLEETPQPLLEKALENVTEPASLVQSVCLQGRVPIPILKRLLTSTRWEIAGAAAAGEWIARNKVVREDIQREWRAAILRIPATDRQIGHWLKQILAGNSALAKEWLDRHLQESGPSHYPLPLLPFRSALRALDSNQRVQLLRELKPASILHSIISELIGRDTELYRALLANEELRGFALDVLRRKPDESWKELALSAVEAGMEPAAIAEAAIFVGETYAAPGVEHWRERELLFKCLDDESHEGLREIGRYGRAFAQKRLAKAEEELRLVQLHGLAHG